jgi:hypothetical protein
MNVRVTLVRMLACISPLFRLIDPLSFEARSIGTTKEKSQEEKQPA